MLSVVGFPASPEQLLTTGPALLVFFSLPRKSLSLSEDILLCYNIEDKVFCSVTYYLTRSLENDDMSRSSFVAWR